MSATNSGGDIPVPAAYFSMPLETSPATDHPDISDRALTALQSHREAERRRRERIKSHLDRLRTVLACDPKVT